MIGEGLLFNADGDSKPLTATQEKKPLAAATLAQRSGGFLWLGLTNPSEAEMTEIAKIYDLQPRAVSAIPLLLPFNGPLQRTVESDPRHDTGSIPNERIFS